MAKKYTRDRAEFILAVEKMPFWQQVMYLEQENRRFLAVIIDEWIEKAIEDKLSLFDWLEKQFKTGGPRPKIQLSLHEENQAGIPRALRPDLKK
jgi:hypothetical protein